MENNLKLLIREVNRDVLCFLNHLYLFSVGIETSSNHIYRGVPMAVFSCYAGI